MREGILRTYKCFVNKRKSTTSRQFLFTISDDDDGGCGGGGGGGYGCVAIILKLLLLPLFRICVHFFVRCFFRNRSTFFQNSSLSFSHFTLAYAVLLVINGKLKRCFCVKPPTYFTMKLDTTSTTDLNSNDGEKTQWMCGRTREVETK